MFLRFPQIYYRGINISSVTVITSPTMPRRFFRTSRDPSSGDASNKVPKISAPNGNDFAPTGISAQPVHSSSSGVPDARRNRFVERPCRRRVVEVDWKRGLSAVSQWSGSNACRPKKRQNPRNICILGFQCALYTRK